MPPALPNELLELCIDHLAFKPREDCIQDLISCSLANSALLAQCQRYIFHTVNLWLYVPDGDRAPSAETLDYHHRSLLFIQAIIYNPSLALHVQCLSHRITSIPWNGYEGMDSMLRAFELMPNIVDFELAHRRPAPVIGPVEHIEFAFRAEGSIGSQWKECIMSIVGRPTLRALALRNIFGFPINGISPSIRDLHLKESSFDLQDVSTMGSIAKGESQNQLRVLACDAKTLRPFTRVYLESAPQHAGPPKIDLSTLQKLSVELTIITAEAQLQLLLGQSTCLRELEIRVGRSIRSQFIRSTISPIRSLQPASMATLSCLTIHDDAFFSVGETLHTQPYTSVVGDVLLELKRLKTLRYNMTWSGLLTVDPDTFTSNRWDSLPNLLAQPDACPLLQEVTIRAQMMADINLTFAVERSGGNIRIQDTGAV
ncbi:hypothetical protein NMY22_g12602 [Coprinellus aureogranulatus]|nr:hypothetical protein NMY22_g12602 [Coprinellus aureogranulatus]